MKRVAIIMPSVDGSNWGWWREAIISLEKQSYPLEYMHLFQVVRHIPGRTPVVPTTMIESTTIPYESDSDYPTAMEQIGIGFAAAKNYDYVVKVDCNDIFSPGFIWGAVDALEGGATVAYSGYTVFLDGETMDVPLWCDLDKRGFGDGNPIPDFAMMKPWVAQWFNPKRYGRASFYVMWTELFLSGGAGAFAYVPKIGYGYRHHGGISTNEEYLEEFRKTAGAFLHEKGLLPEDQSLVMGTLAQVAEKHPMGGAHG